MSSVICFCRNDWRLSFQSVKTHYTIISKDRTASLLYVEEVVKRVEKVEETGAQIGFI